MSNVLLQNAWRLHQSGNLDEAARLYNETLKINPRDARALQMLGFLHFQREEFAQADEVMARALKVEPNSVDVLYNRGCVLQALDRHRDAASCFEKALTLNRNHAPAHFNLGNSLFRLGRHTEALASYGRALKIHPAYPEALLNRANAYLEMKRAGEALADYEQALKLLSSHPVIWNNRGNALSELGREVDAIASFDKAIALEPRYSDAIENRADALARMNRADDALQGYARVLDLEPENAGAEHKRARLLADMKRPEDALAAFDRVLTLRPGDAAAMLGRGVALLQLERFEEALAVFDAVLAVEPADPDARSNRAHALIGAKRFAEALAESEKALVLDGAHRAALHNLASALSGLRRFTEAVAAFDKALALEESAESLTGRGSALLWLKNIAGALQDFDKALARDPSHLAALVNRAAALSKAKRYAEAAAAAERALVVRPDHPPAMRELVHARLNCCDWRARESDSATVAAMLAAGQRPAQPFDHLAIADSEASHLALARIHVREEYPPQPALWRGERYGHGKIRVGYLSTDLRAHAIGFLIVGALEHHDKSRFEIHGFSIGSDDGSPVRKRIVSAFNRFADLRQNTDLDAASLIRDSEIDILVDVNAYTGDGRSGIMAYRPAPVQVNYLGYPGTTGAPYIDYIVADRVVIPDTARAHYSESVVYLPYCYQANDDKRHVSDKVFTRAQCDLPERGFVFCSLSSSYKFSPPIFDVWMRILSQVPDSVLWLLRDNDAATANLCREAEARGISASRLVFAPHVPPDEHLARQRLADVFLDTLPYNAHTTASDSLWMGLPVVTCIGAAFPGRVAASILKAAGLPELVTQSLEDYEALALRLARDPVLLAVVKAKIAAIRESCALFDTARFTRHLEAAYEGMMARHARGENPSSFAVPDDLR